MNHSLPLLELTFSFNFPVGFHLMFSKQHQLKSYLFWLFAFIKTFLLEESRSFKNGRTKSF